MQISKIFHGYYRKLILLIFDAVSCVIIDVLYLIAARMSSTSPDYKIDKYMANTILMMFCMFAVRIFLKVYKNVWRYPNIKAYFSLICSDAIGAMIALTISRFSGVYEGIWQFVIVASLCSLLALMSRFVYQFIYRNSNKKISDESELIDIAIVGAGRVGSVLAQELISNPKSEYNPVCFIDDDNTKIGNLVVGLPVYGQNSIEKVVSSLGIKEFVVTITDMDVDKMNKLHEQYSKFGKVKIYDSPFGKSDSNEKKIIRDFQIEDLLFRNPIKMENRDVLKYYSGKTVLVTGGGGSIGSELCRQIASCAPKKLVIFDIYENNAYEIQQELVRHYGNNLDLTVLIGSVRDRERIEQVFAEYHPDVVFHAAAHKHVPFMEESAGEAIKNNVLGTYNTADMAEKYGAEKFILISTDKAVNPTNIMGASKRICEMEVQCRTDSKTCFAAVRFGNVLGSNGSVIPLFKRQIAEGGPVTLTDKRIIRYFMTIPEASQLVIQAGAMAKKGELFVLDMGKPVKISDLAVNMIKLSGLKPEEDISIKEIGLRPGEKLYEELLMKTETLDKTANDMIYIEHDTPYTRAEVDQKLMVLTSAVKNGTSIKAAIESVVPTFCEPETVNIDAENSEEMQIAFA